jgi:AcrR family transcriptional regulator
MRIDNHNQEENCMPRRPGTSRTKPPEERREDLIAAAAHLFQTNGIEPTTVEQITVEAGVAKGTFYLYFSSKDDVVNALRDQFVHLVLNSIRNGVKSKRKDDWDGKLAAWVLGCTKAYLEAARLHDIIFSEGPPPSRTGLSNNLIVDELTELLADGSAANAWTVVDARFVSIFLFNALHGVVNDAKASSSPNKNHLVKEMRELFIRVVGSRADVREPQP